MSRLKTTSSHKGATTIDKNKRRKKKSTPRRSSASGSSSSSSTSAHTSSTSTSTSTSSTAATLSSTSTKETSSTSGMKNSNTSPTNSTCSSSGKECEQCGNQTVLDIGTNPKAIANSKKVYSSGCQICDYVVYRKSQRPCVHCERIQCEYFCEWCGNGYHAKCARARDENVTSPNGFCCKKCEAEQAEDDDEDDDDEKEDDVNAKCGECELPFNSTSKENERDNDDITAATGFQVNQSVLVENDEVLYNAVITDVDAKNERIKIHFLRWSKSFDNWYAMDDERINESLACDCCNRWFHIGCLPPIKSSGRFKDTTYVCPTCLEDAAGFYAGTSMRTAAAKATKAIATSATGSSSSSASSSTSASANTSTSSSSSSGGSSSSRPSRKTSIAEESAAAASPQPPKKRSSSKAIIVQSDSEEEEAELRITKPTKVVSKSESSSKKSASSKESNESSKSKAKSKSSSSTSSSNKRKRSNSSDSVSSISEKKSSRSPVKKAREEVSSKSSKKRDRSVSHDDEATTDELHSSPEHSATNKTAQSETEATSPLKTATTEPSSTSIAASAAAHQLRRKTSGGHSVSSILNSPSSPARDSTPPIRPQSAPHSGNSKSPSDGVVKVEKDPLTLPAPAKKPRTSTTSSSARSTVWPSTREDKYSKSASTSSKSASTSSKSSSTSNKSSSTSNKSSSSSRGSLSAFDILREVAAQSMSDDLEAEANATAAVAVPPTASSSRKTSKNADKKTIKDDPAQRDAERAKILFGKNDKGMPPPAPAPMSMNSYIDHHFAIRKEIYLRICQLEEEWLVERETAQLLRSLIYPTSDRFHDLKFVYMVNKDLPSLQLTKRLLELVPITAGGTAPVIPVMPKLPPPLPRPPLAVSSLNGSSGSCCSSAAPSPVRHTTPSLLPSFPMEPTPSPISPAELNREPEPEVDSAPATAEPETIPDATFPVSSKADTPTVDTPAVGTSPTRLAESSSSSLSLSCAPLVAPIEPQHVNSENSSSISSN